MPQAGNLFPTIECSVSTSGTNEGNHQYGAFMEANIERRFFEPDFEGKLLGRDRWDVYDEMQEKVKKLTGSLLNEHFPNMRQGEVSREIKVKDSIMVSKNKGIRM